MRLRKFHAPTMGEAMERVRETLGEDAIIVSTIRRRRGRGVEVTAAKEAATVGATDYGIATDNLVPESDEIRSILRYHGVSALVSERLATTSVSFNEDDQTLAFANALNTSFTFLPVPTVPQRPIMLIGLPGAGKTVTTAKLAARAALAGASIGVMTTDCVRAGGVDQLTSFTDILSAEVGVAETVEDAVAGLQTLARCDAVFIDTPGTNPFDAGEINDLKSFVDNLDVEPIMVAAAGGDTMEMAEAAEIFANLGARRFVATRLDIARRLGGLLDIAERSKMALADVSATPFIAQGLLTLNPVSLARLMQQAASKAGAIENFDDAPRAEGIAT